MEAKEMEVNCNRRYLIEGLFLILLGILFPSFITERTFHIYGTLSLAMLNSRGDQLVLGASLLVFMNSLRAVPHYLGAFFISDSLKISIYGKRRFAFNVVITCFTILLVYGIINKIYKIRYDFGIPAVMIVAFVLILSCMDLFSVNVFNKILIVTSLLLSIQWLDVIPFLTAYGFGGGEISMDVKTAAILMREERLLTYFSFCFFAAFLFSSLIQVQLLYKEHKLKVTAEANRRVEKELHDTQIQALEMRSHSEVQNLVHDLKTPLTTVQGLVSLAEMIEENPLIQEYYEKINISLSSMNLMISEILYEENKSVFSTEALLQTVLAHTSILVPPDMLEYKNSCPNARLLGNRIRLSRAIINTIENAFHAVDPVEGKISVIVAKPAGNGMIYIFVKDNGVGIAADKLQHIWELGYSENHSTGLGLGFTRQVVENHHGLIKIESEKGKYTKVTICLKEEL